MTNKTYEVYGRSRKRVLLSFDAETATLQPDGTYLCLLEGEAEGTTLHLHIGETLREKDGPNVEVR